MHLVYNVLLLHLAYGWEGIAENSSLTACWLNARSLNTSIQSLSPGESLVIGKNETYYSMGGIYADGLENVTMKIVGEVRFCSQYIEEWPRDSSGHVLECMRFSRSKNLQLLSGTLDGQGDYWWGFIGYLKYQENRPRILRTDSAEGLLVDGVHFKNSPYWTLYADSVNNIEIRYSTIDNRRRANATNHNAYELTAFNTDGFDISGNNVYIHDCYIWCQDDAISVKDNSQNMKFERIQASGLGATIGSIAGTLVRNITFSDIYMYKPYKGIYLKFRGDAGIIQDVIYQNIYIYQPSQWPIWIGPAQQSDSIRFCAAHPCSLCWPFYGGKCEAPLSTYTHLTFRNVTIVSPAFSAGVIFANESTPIINLTFDDVIVQNPNDDGVWGTDQYFCQGVSSGFATGKTNPIPPCFSH